MVVDRAGCLPPPGAPSTLPAPYLAAGLRLQRPGRGMSFLASAKKYRTGPYRGCGCGMGPRSVRRSRAAVASLLLRLDWTEA